MDPGLASEKGGIPPAVAVGGGGQPVLLLQKDLTVRTHRGRILLHKEKDVLLRVAEILMVP